MQIENWNRQHDSLLRIKKSGLVVEDVVIKDNEDYIIHNIKDKELKEGKQFSDKQKHFLNKQNEFKALCSSLGGFVNMIYTKNELLFNRINIDKANISRIIYLATYIDYNNRKEGLLIYQAKNKEGQFQETKEMSRADIRNVLGLTDSTFKRFLKNVKDNNLLFEVDGKFYINTEYFNKGEMSRIEDNKSYCRLFINTIRDLYEGTKSTKHKVLASVFQLIPYIHYEHNIVCHNPNETTENPRAITLVELCEMFGVSYENRSKLAKQLYEFKVNIKEEEYHLFTYVILNAQYDYFLVNPLVIYSGNNLESIKRTAKAMFFNEYTHRQKRK